jgi:hypothetical protein
MSNFNFKQGKHNAFMRKSIAVLAGLFRQSGTRAVRPGPAATRDPALAGASLRLSKLSIWTFAILVLLGGFGLWSLLVANRYQALCQISYWRSSLSDIRSCDEIGSELPDRR